MQSISINIEKVQLIAEMAHEANRSYCRSIGDDSQPSWNDAPGWQRESAFAGVMFHVNNPFADAGASHQSWYDQKLAEGWSYGPVKDPENKKHPCMVHFGELPIDQQIKDHIFKNTVHGAIAVLGRRTLV